MSWLIGLLLLGVGVIGGLIFAAFMAFSLWAEDIKKDEDN